MAIKVKDYEMPDKSIVPDAYLRVKNILVEVNDYELLEPLTDDPEGDLKVTWVTRYESKASIYVYADDQCRRNNVSPIHWYAIDFNFKPELPILSQAYSVLKNRFPNTDDC